MNFSIVCLTYKRIHLLEEALFSVLQQTNQNFEFLIINDNPKQKLHFNSDKVRIFNLDKKFDSLGEKRNFGKSQAKGKFILQLDDDDLLLPTYIQNLENIIADGDYLYPQKPIIYYNENKIFLSPEPLLNTFLYKDTISKLHNYDPINFDELTPFFLKVRRTQNIKKRFVFLKPNECGYVYRQTIDENKKYSMGLFKTETIQEQNKILNDITEKEGDIYLNPKWEKDYTSIILQNCKFPSSKKASNITNAIQKDAEDWKKSKLTWENALKAINSIKSRGILSTIASELNINKNLGERVSEDIYLKRKLSCFGSVEKNIKTCENFRNIPNQGSYCGACGCGAKDIARLDSDDPTEYTKLHYPLLECPLQKPGFSNYNEDSILSIIITCCNESEFFLNRTIDSIRKTAGNRPEIIIVDDASIIPVKSKERVIRNDERMGVGRSRHKGATFASNKYLLFTDGHMIFDDGWYDNFIERSKTASIDDVFCGTCLALDEKDTDLSTHKGIYYGARLELYDKKENQILEGKWIPEKKENEYEISCLMGALYFIRKEFFFKIRGLSDIKMWGSDEPLLSLKTLLSGGKIFILKNVRAGHVFRDKSPYTTNISYLLYNKMRIAKTILPDKLGELLIDKIPRNENFYEAMNMILKEKNIIDEYKKYYQSIFIREFVSICNEYKITESE